MADEERIQLERKRAMEIADVYWQALAVAHRDEGIPATTLVLVTASLFGVLMADAVDASSSDAFKHDCLVLVESAFANCLNAKVLLELKSAVQA